MQEASFYSMLNISFWFFVKADRVPGEDLSLRGVS